MDLTKHRWNKLLDFEKLTWKEHRPGKAGPSVPSAQRALAQGVRFLLRRNPYVQIASFVFEYVQQAGIWQDAVPGGPDLSGWEVASGPQCPGAPVYGPFRVHSATGECTTSAATVTAYTTTNLGYAVIGAHRYISYKSEWEYTGVYRGNFSPRYRQLNDTPYVEPQWLEGQPERMVGWVVNEYPGRPTVQIDPSQFRIPARLIPVRDAAQKPDEGNPEETKRGGAARLPNWRTRPNLVIQPGTKPHPQKPDHENKPPGPGRKERKFKLALPSGALASIYGFVGETGDFVDAFHDALPEGCKAKPVKLEDGPREARFRYNLRRGSQKREYRQPSTLEKMEALYNCFQNLDLPKALENLALNQIEDYALGKVGQITAKANARSGRAAGFQFGPAM